MKNIIMTLSIMTLTFIAGIAPALALGGAATNQACQGLSQVGSDGCGSGGKQVDNVLKTVVSIISYIAGAVAIIMVMISGFNFMTANGDAQKITTAKNSLIYAMIGIAVAASAQVIVNFAVRAGNSTG
jgi:hypothetical protein